MTCPSIWSPDGRHLWLCGQTIEQLGTDEACRYCGATRHVDFPTIHVDSKKRRWSGTIPNLKPSVSEVVEIQMAQRLAHEGMKGVRP